MAPSRRGREPFSVLSRTRDELVQYVKETGFTHVEFFP
jgi:1,4-alpha-glucan branching enzyme